MSYRPPMQPGVSVVVPVYNRAHSVLPTLRSVQGQTMTDWECIVVDDGSADGEQLRRVVESLADPRFRYVRRANGGGGAARNTGIDEARGEVIAFLDSDDRWLPEKLAADLAGGAERQPVFSQVKVERGGRIVGVRPASAPRPNEPIGDYLACRQGFVPTSTLALPLRMAKQIRYSDSLPFGQDTDFAIRIGSRQPIVMLSRSLALINDDEDVSRVSRSTRWQAVLAWVEEIRPLLSTRAYHAMRGWHAARLAAHSGYLAKGLGLYSAAVTRGALPPALALKALAQILIPRTVYARFRR